MIDFEFIDFPTMDTITVYIYIYILKAKVWRKFNYISIGFSILCHVSHLIFNFYAKWIIKCKNQKSKSNLESNWISIGVYITLEMTHWCNACITWMMMTWHIEVALCLGLWCDMTHKIQPLSLAGLVSLPCGMTPCHVVIIHKGKARVIC